MTEIPSPFLCPKYNKKNSIVVSREGVGDGRTRKVTAMCSCRDCGTKWKFQYTKHDPGSDIRIQILDEANQ